MSNEAVSFENILPESVLQRVLQPINEKAGESELYRRYYPIFRGFEEFDMLRFLTRDYIEKFEQALQDFLSCMRCDGHCRSSLSGRNQTGQKHYYFAISYDGMKFYKGACPVFIARECPGVAARKEEIRKLLIREE